MPLHNIYNYKFFFCFFPQSSHISFEVQPSRISSLLEVKHCCSNLVSLTINYFEQIDGKQLALLAAACPLLQSLHLNADDQNFQREPIDEGVLGLGQYLANKILEQRSTSVFHSISYNLIFETNNETTRSDVLWKDPKKKHQKYIPLCRGCVLLVLIA